MRIPSDIQVNQHTAARNSALEVLGLKSGQSFTAEVLGQNASGATQLRVGGQQVLLNLPVKPQLGQILQFHLGGTTAKPELTLLSETGRPQPVPTGLASQGRAPVSSLAPQTTSNAAIISTPSATATPQSPITIPITPNTAATLQLQPGQIVTAQVAPPTQAGQPQISIGNQQIQIPAPIPGTLPPGTPLQVRADFSAGTPRLVVVPQSTTPPTPSGSLSSTPSAAPSSSPAYPPSSTSGLPPASASVTAATVQQAITQTIATSVTNQNSLAALLSTITGLKTNATQLPTGVNLAIDRVLGTQINLDTQPPTAELLRDAVGRAGVFLEASLARGQSLPQVQADTKALLLLLKNALGNWLGGDDALQHAPGKKPPPPAQGNNPRAQLPDPPPLPSSANPREAGRHLNAQTDAALSRLKLFQMASLPEGAIRSNPAAAQEWNFELPFTLGNQTSMAQFQISRDAEGEAEEIARGWQLAFAMNFKVIGEVGAKVSLRAKKTGVMLWAENEETTEVLAQTLPELSASLEALGLEVGSIHVRQGAPEAKPTPAGGFVDSLT